MALHILRQLGLYALQKSHKKGFARFLPVVLQIISVFSHNWSMVLIDDRCCVLTNRHSGWKKIVFTWWLLIVPAGRFLFWKKMVSTFSHRKLDVLTLENVVIMKVIMILIMMMSMMTMIMMMILHLWNDAVILKLLLQQSIFLLQCFHLTIIIIIILMMRIIF